LRTCSSYFLTFYPPFLPSFLSQEPHCDDHHSAPFGSLMPGIMAMKLKLQSECADRNTCRFIRK
jgi:hypothetical protein